MARGTGGSKYRKTTKEAARFPLVEDIFDESDGGLDDGTRTIIQPEDMADSSDDDSDDDGGLGLTSKGSATGGVTKKAAKGGAAAGRLPRGGAAGLPLDLSMASREKSSTRKGKGKAKSKPSGGAETAVDLSSEEPVHQPHELAKGAKANKKNARLNKLKKAPVASKNTTNTTNETADAAKTPAVDTARLKVSKEERQRLQQLSVKTSTARREELDKSLVASEQAAKQRARAMKAMSVSCRGCKAGFGVVVVSSTRVPTQHTDLLTLANAVSYTLFILHGAKSGVYHIVVGAL